MSEREAALDEAIAACIARERDALSRVVGDKSPLQVSVLYVSAQEARSCAEAIAMLKERVKK